MLDLRPGLGAPWGCQGAGPELPGALTAQGLERKLPANPSLLRTVENPGGSCLPPTEVQGQEQNLFKITYGTQSQF